MNEQTVAAARAYLHKVEHRLQDGDLAMCHLNVTLSVVTSYDIAGILVREAEEVCITGSM